MVSPKAPDSGGMRERIRFVAPNKQLDQTRLNQPMETPIVLLDDIPAKVLQVAGGEQVKGGVQMVAGAEYLVEVAFIQELRITPDLWIEWDGGEPGTVKRLNILDVRDPEQLRRRQWFQCRAEPLEVVP